MDRNIEDDLENLIGFAKTCFIRSGNDIPAYNGQLIERKFWQPNLDELLNPKSKTHKWHKEQGRDLLAIVIICAWQLGFDTCYLKDVEPEKKLTGLFMSLHKDEIEDLRHAENSFTECGTHEGLTVGLIDAIITISKVLHKQDLINSLEIDDALSDLRSTKEIKNLMNKKWLQEKKDEAFEKRTGKKIYKEPTIKNKTV